MLQILYLSQENIYLLLSVFQFVGEERSILPLMDLTVRVDLQYIVICQMNAVDTSSRSALERLSWITESPDQRHFW